MLVATRTKNLKEFVRARPHLVWYVAPSASLTEESVVEHVLNYGTWKDVQEVITLLGKDRVAQIFRSHETAKRNNYRPEIRNFFSLYFSRYAE